MAAAEPDADLQPLWRAVSVAGPGRDVDLVTAVGGLAMGGKVQVAVGGNGRVEHHRHPVDLAVDPHRFPPAGVVAVDVPDIGAWKRPSIHRSDRAGASGVLRTVGNEEQAPPVGGNVWLGILPGAGEGGYADVSVTFFHALGGKNDRLP